jgi:hypothetical protein
LNKFIEILSEIGNFEMNGGKVGFATVGSLIEVVGSSTFVPKALVGSCCLMLGFPGYWTRLALSSSASKLLD